MRRAEIWAAAVLVVALDLARPVVRVELTGWPTPVPTPAPTPIYHLPDYRLGQHIDTQQTIDATYQDGSDAFIETEMVVGSDGAGEVRIPPCPEATGSPDTRYAVAIPTAQTVTEIVIDGTNDAAAWTEQTTPLTVGGSDHKLWVTTEPKDCTAEAGAAWRIRSR